MNPDELPHCEFDRKTGKLVTFKNCANEADRYRAAKERIQRNRERLKVRSGLTNKKRRRLHKEIVVLERWLESMRPAPIAEIDNKRKERRLKATQKKLQWLGKRVDQARLVEG
jgi:lysyl-tRNA synthetase class I